LADIEVRGATPSDHSGILDVVRAAFAVDGADGEPELHVVRASWERGVVVDGLELVAVTDGEVIGHAMAAWGSLAGRPVAGVAPLAVAPPWQGRGIGKLLMIELLVRAEEQSLPLVALLGDPAYYGRFGFEPAGPLGITYPPVAEGPYFQVRRLSAYDPSHVGAFTYGWEG
jgi:putative acetyltransferase